MIVAPYFFHAFSVMPIVNEYFNANLCSPCFLQRIFNWRIRYSVWFASLQKFTTQVVESQTTRKKNESWRCFNKNSSWFLHASQDAPAQNSHSCRLKWENSHTRSMLWPNNNCKMFRTTWHSLHGVTLAPYPTSHFYAKNSSATRITCPIFRTFHCRFELCSPANGNRMYNHDGKCDSRSIQTSALFFMFISIFSGAPLISVRFLFHLQNMHTKPYLFCPYLFAWDILIDLTNGYDFLCPNFLLLFGVFVSFLSVAGSRNHLQHMQKRDSKSFDSGALYRPDVDDDSNGTSSMERIERNDSKIMLPTPPIRKSPLATASANQSEDHSITSIDRNKTDTNNTVDGHNDSNKSETEPTATEPNEVWVRYFTRAPINDNCDSKLDFLLIALFFPYLFFRTMIILSLVLFSFLLRAQCSLRLILTTNCTKRRAQQSCPHKYWRNWEAEKKRRH